MLQSRAFSIMLRARNRAAAIKQQIRTLELSSRARACIKLGHIYFSLLELAIDCKPPPPLLLAERQMACVRTQRYNGRATKFDARFFAQTRRATALLAPLISRVSKVMLL